MQLTTDTDWVPQVLYNMANAMFLPSLAQNASFGLIYAAGFLDITGIPAAASRLSYYTGGGSGVCLGGPSGPRPLADLPGS